MVKCRVVYAWIALGLICNACFAAPGLEEGSVYRGLRFAEDWKDYYVFLARFEPGEQIGNGQPAAGVARLVVESNYNPDVPVPREFVLPTWTLWQSPDPADRWDAQKPKPGVHVVVWMPQKLPAYMSPNAEPKAFYTVVDTTQTKGPDAVFIHSLELIAAYRGAVGDGQAKAATAIFTGETDLALQYLCGAWARGKKVISPEEKTQLLTVRDNEKLAVYTRLLASRVLNAHDTDYAQGYRHYNWVLQWFKQPHKLDASTWNHLLDDLNEFTPPEDRGKFDATLWPLFKQALLNPKTDDSEVQALLQKISFTGGANDIQTGTKHMITAFLFDQSTHQVTDEESLLYLKSGEEMLTNMFMQVVSTGKSEDFTAFRASLLKYENTLRTMLSKAADARIRDEIETVLSEISYWMKQQPPVPKAAGDPD